MCFPLNSVKTDLHQLCLQLTPVLHQHCVQCPDSWPTPALYVAPQLLSTPALCAAPRLLSCTNTLCSSLSPGLEEARHMPCFIASSTFLHALFSAKETCGRLFSFFSTKDENNSPLCPWSRCCTRLFFSLTNFLKSMPVLFGLYPLLTLQSTAFSPTFLLPSACPLTNHQIQLICLIL